MDGLNSSFYLLRWSDHIANYADVFLTLREEEEFVDCSFACEDGVVGAHRLVLAGCSPYLRDLLKRSSNPHPIIFLINVSRSTVLLLMEFIYRGQAHIPHNRLHQLVTLGRTMQIKGLSQIQLPPKYSSVLPSIPRLHGSPDPVTELDDTMLERDSSDDNSLSHENNNNIESTFDEEDSTPISERIAARVVQQKDLVTMSSPPRSQKNDKENTESPPVRNQEKTTLSKENDLSTRKQENNRKSLKDNTPQKDMNQYQTRERSKENTNQHQTRERSKENTNQHQTRERSSGSPKKHILDSKSDHYVPKPKSKKMEELKGLPGCPKTNTMPKKAQEVKKANKVINLKKVKSKTNVEKVEKIKKKPGRKENPKVKHPVFKTKKIQKIPKSLKKMKSEPKTRLYNGGLKMKLELGTYALRHGIEDAQRYVLARYGVKIRPKSIENMMTLTSVFNRKKPGRKNYEAGKKRPFVRSEDDSTVERKTPKGRPRTVDLAELTGRPRKSITFDVERFFGRARKRTEENDRSPKRARDSTTLVMPVENCQTCVGCMVHKKKQSPKAVL